MNYEKIYQNLIISRFYRKNNNGYYEKHHIWPKSLGGPNVSWNIIKLTAREHFIAHWLLYKLSENINDKIKMGYALNAMCNLIANTNRNISSYQYQVAKRANSLSAKKRIGESNPFYGKKHNKITKEHLSDINKKSFNERYGNKSQEIKGKISKKLKNREPWNKNKTYKELYGNKAEEIKLKIQKGAAKRRKKTLITRPDGDQIIVDYLKDFCETETKKTGIRINYSNMKSVANGNQSHHKNYLAEYIIQ